MTSTLTQQHRAAQLTIRRRTIADLERLWPALEWARLDATYPSFAVSVGAMVERHRQTSAGLAAAYLRAFRRAVGVPGEVRPVFAQPLIVDQFATSLRVTSVASLKSAAQAGVPADVAMDSAKHGAANAMARLVLNGGRETIIETTRADSAASGWRRILGSGGCDFCRMLAGRGGVYSEETAHFEAHDKCGCTVEPAY